MKRLFLMIALVIVMASLFIPVSAFAQSDLGFLNYYVGCTIYGYWDGPGDGGPDTSFRHYRSLPPAQRGSFVQTSDYPVGCSQY